MGISSENAYRGNKIAQIPFMNTLPTLQHLFNAYNPSMTRTEGGRLTMKKTKGPCPRRWAFGETSPKIEVKYIVPLLLLQPRPQHQ